MNVLSDPAVRIVIGHRGAAARFPENTAASFDYAVALGVDAIEFDLRVRKLLSQLVERARRQRFQDGIRGKRNGCALRDRAPPVVRCGATGSSRWGVAASLGSHTLGAKRRTHPQRETG